MNVQALIDAIVRQTTILIAQLATAAGGRAQLAHTANQVFLDLVGALREQGLNNKVIADMFGLALRTYQERVRRLSESQTIRGRSLWEAVLEHIEHQGPVLRADVMTRFRYDEEISVRGVLRDLVHSGVVYRTGRGEGVMYRVAAGDELEVSARSSREGLHHLVWVAVQQAAPVTRAQLLATLALSEEALGRSVDVLLERGWIRPSTRGDEPSYESDGCVLPYDDAKGWEGAVFDHYQALVGALCAKLGTGQKQARRSDVIGGSTFGFEVWPGHPLHEEVLGLLGRFREQAGELRARVAAHNQTHDADQVLKRRVITYVGQNVMGGDDDADDNSGKEEE